MLTNRKVFDIIVERFEEGTKETDAKRVTQKVFLKKIKNLLKKVLTNPKKCGRIKVRHKRGSMQDLESEWQRSLKIEQQMRKYKAQEVKRNT